MNTRWTCPNGKHPTVMAPTKPRRDDVRRYCLPCSEAKGRLVQRVAPTLDARRERAEEKRKLTAKAKTAREREQEDAYFMVHGVDLRAELKKLFASKVAQQYAHQMRRHFTVLPTIVVRTRSTPNVRRYGVAYTSRHQILINRIPGQDQHTVRETLAHELAHILTPTPGHGHDHVWKSVFRQLCEQVYDVRPHVENRFISTTKSTSASAQLRAAAGDSLPAEPARPVRVLKGARAGWKYTSCRAILVDRNGNEIEGPLPQMYWGSQ